MEKRDLYEVMGVSKQASADEVKRAHRKLVKKYHPDQNPNDANAEQAFKDVQHAYSILSDKDKRAQYDRFGEVGAGSFQTDASGHNVYTWGSQGSHIDAEDLESLFSVFGVGGSGGASPFDQVFGQRGRGRRVRRQPPVRGQDVQQRINLSFEQAVKGVSIEVDVRSGRGQKRDTLSVAIPPGVTDGQKIRLSGKGLPGGNGGPPGDLYLVCAVRPHKYFRRDGRDILLDVPITIDEAVLGTKVDIPTLDGLVSLAVPPGTSGGTKLRLRGKGVPAHGSRSVGDQYVSVRIVVPKKPTKKQKGIIEQFAGTSDQNSRAELGW